MWRHAAPSPSAPSCAPWDAAAVTEVLTGLFQTKQTNNEESANNNGQVFWRIHVRQVGCLDLLRHTVQRPTRPAQKVAEDEPCGDRQHRISCIETAGSSGVESLVLSFVCRRCEMMHGGVGMLPRVQQAAAYAPPGAGVCLLTVSAWRHEEVRRCKRRRRSQ